MYRKISADHVFTGYEILQQHVLITDTKGVTIDIVDEKEAGDDIEKYNGLLSPGFINTHCHLELSHMKGLIPKQTGLGDFVFKVVNERHFEDEQILTAIENAEYEMLQSGIVAVGDICNNTFTIPQKTKGRLQYHNFIEASGFLPAFAQDRFEKSLTILDKYRSTMNDHRSTISPHAPYSVSPEMFRMINDFPNNNLITIHNQETAAENELFEEGSGDFLQLYEKMGIDISFFKPSGRSSLQTWLPYFTKDQSIILVHNVATSEMDIKSAKLQTANLPVRQAGYKLPTGSCGQIFFCLCPNANLYISNSLPDVNMLIKQGCDIVLGTDSLASNDQLSILEEIKTLHKNFQELNLKTTLQWATINGARALQMDDRLGSFEKGKQPALVLIEGLENLQTNNRTSARRIL